MYSKQIEVLARTPITAMLRISERGPKIRGSLKIVLDARRSRRQNQAGRGSYVAENHRRDSWCVW
jgi:hypothetical protein